MFLVRTPQATTPAPGMAPCKHAPVHAPWSSAASRRVVARGAVLAAALAPALALTGVASASTPSASALVEQVEANMKTVPAIGAWGSESGLSVRALYVAHPQSTRASISGTVKGSKITISMIDIGRKNWTKANETGWQLLTLGLVAPSTLSKLSPHTWYSSAGTSTVDLGKSLCASTSSGSKGCILKGTRLVSYSASRAVISVTSPKETVTLGRVRGKLLATSVLATGSAGATVHFSYPTSAPEITAPSGAKPFPARH